MKKLLSILALAILSLQAYSQAHNPLWSTKIRKTCFYGIANSPVPIYDIAASDAQKVGVVSIYDSINFVHKMNGYWYVLTDKGGNGYIKNLRYRPIDIDSIKNAEKYRLLAIKEAKEKAARDSALAAERRLLAYSTFDSATAGQLLQSKLWEGMTPDMAKIALGEPIHALDPMANGSTFATWEYESKCLYFNGGCLEVYEDIVEIPLPEEQPQNYHENKPPAGAALPIAGMPSENATGGMSDSQPDVINDEQVAPSGLSETDAGLPVTNTKVTTPEPADKPTHRPESEPGETQAVTETD